MKKKAGLFLVAALMLTGCGTQTDDTEMHYVKTSVLYDTLVDMYSNPDDYLGKNYHMVGTLYPTTDDDETFYSIYADGTGGAEGLGLELDWDDFSAYKDFDTIMVEGKIDRVTATHEGKEITYLVMRVSQIEKRDE